MLHCGQLSSHTQKWFYIFSPSLGPLCIPNSVRLAFHSFYYYDDGYTLWVRRLHRNTFNTKTFTIWWLHVPLRSSSTSWTPAELMKFSFLDTSPQTHWTGRQTHTYTSDYSHFVYFWYKQYELNSVCVCPSNIIHSVERTTYIVLLLIFHLRRALDCVIQEIILFCSVQSEPSIKSGAMDIDAFTRTTHICQCKRMSETNSE